jgi:hypothetical protein
VRGPPLRDMLTLADVDPLACTESLKRTPTPPDARVLGPLARNEDPLVRMELRTVARTPPAAPPSSPSPLTPLKPSSAWPILTKWDTIACSLYTAGCAVQVRSRTGATQSSATQPVLCKCQVVAWGVQRRGWKMIGPLGASVSDGVPWGRPMLRGGVTWGVTCCALVFLSSSN